jgi:hypothetical protein
VSRFTTLRMSSMVAIARLFKPAAGLGIYRGNRIARFF